MKHIRLPVLLFLCLAGTVLLLACAVSPSAATLPTVVAPAAAPTSVPPTTAPTVAPASTNTPTAAATSGTPDEIVADAFAKLNEATTFRMQALTELSPIFFQGQYTPLPGEDPDVVNLFTIEGEQNTPDLHYALSGFLASFIGLFSGFDPDINEIEIAQVDGARYTRGILDGETEAVWYRLAEDPSSSSSFAPQEMVLPMTAATYPAGSFSKTGTATVGAETCDVYTGNRAAFDAVYPSLISAALLNEETLDLESMDRTEYTVTVCPDGNVYRIAYNFDAHAKDNADENGTFTFETEISDFDGDIAITAPADAVPMPSLGGTSSTADPDATPTTAITTIFTTLDGEWEGISGEDSPLSFTVEDGVVTFVNINYSVGSGGCSSSGVMANSVDDGEIQASTFSVVLSDSDDVEYTLQGEFESNNLAAGTLTIQGETFCGETDAEFVWTAQHVSAPDVAESSQPTVEPSIEPTEAPPTRTPTTQPTRTPTTQPTRVPATQTPVPPTAVPVASVDGVKMISDAFAAFAARDLNTALVNVSDNVAFNIGGTTGVGKAALQSNMQLALTFGAQFAVSDIRQTGNIVNFTTTVTGIRAGTYTNSSVIIEDGKIAVFNIN